MLFLGRHGELALAGRSLAVGYANITGYSILSGLAMGMELICGQAFGARKHTLLGLSLERTVLLLLFTSLPISLLWLNMKKIILICGQDEAIAAEAQLYLLCSLPDLLAQSFLHPLRIYLRSQSITLPIPYIPINYFLVSHLDLAIKGVAFSGKEDASKFSSAQLHFCVFRMVVTLPLNSGSRRTSQAKLKSRKIVYVYPVQVPDATPNQINPTAADQGLDTAVNKVSDASADQQQGGDQQALNPEFRGNGSHEVVVRPHLTKSNTFDSQIEVRNEKIVDGNVEDMVARAAHKSEEDRPLQGEAEQSVFFGAKSLAADGFHSHGEAKEDGVTGDVGQAHGGVLAR
ncbi:unnamed protein product [Malus baccata var. baccata]